MIKLAIFALFVATVSAMLDPEFEGFKHRHKKTYRDETEEAYRAVVYRYNKQYIDMHNKLYDQGKSSYYLGENQFTDLTIEEYNSLTSCLNITEEESVLYEDQDDDLYKDVLATDVDWRMKGFVTPVKNQMACGSCWAFSATGSLEGAHFKATGRLVSLSESNLVDCSSKYGNHGCNGGLMNYAFQYIIDNRGIDTETSYPYVPRQRTCQFNKRTIGATMSKYVRVQRSSESDLQRSVASIGPVSVAIDASHPSFQHYSGGVYDEVQCSSSKLNHAVLVVGYGTANGVDYYLVKNSWGTMWGERGYVRMVRNKKNRCGIATMASYPVV